MIKLEENYRSTQPILSLTNDIIRNAAEKYTKTLFSRIEGDILPKLFAGRDERAEAGSRAATVSRSGSGRRPPDPARRPELEVDDDDT